MKSGRLLLLIVSILLLNITAMADEFISVKTSDRDRFKQAMIISLGEVGPRFSCNGVENSNAAQSVIDPISASTWVGLNNNPKQQPTLRFVQYRDMKNAGVKINGTDVLGYSEVIDVSTSVDFKSIASIKWNEYINFQGKQFSGDFR